MLFPIGAKKSVTSTTFPIGIVKVIIQKIVIALQVKNPILYTLFLWYSRLQSYCNMKISVMKVEST